MYIWSTGDGLSQMLTTPHFKMTHYKNSIVQIKEIHYDELNMQYQL